MPVKVLVADAHYLVSDALARSLRQDPELEVCEELPTSGQDLISVVARLKPDVVLLDYWMPGMESPAATRMVVTSSPQTKVLLLSWLFGTELVRLGLEAGALGILPKSISVDQLVQAILRAWAGESPVFQKELEEITGALENRISQDEAVWDKLSALTPREVQILRLLDEGRLIQDVAKELSIKPSTVRNHIHNILEKTGTQTHIQALAMARHHGLIRR